MLSIRNLKMIRLWRLLASLRLEVCSQYVDSVFRCETENLIRSLLSPTGLSSMKLYGMAGLPSESMDDVEETLEMFRKLKSESAKLKSSFRFTFGCSTFVPKAHTPFQWFPVRKDSDKKLKYLDKELRKIGVDFRPESYKWSVIQALISRGDRRVSMVLEKAAEYGGSQGSIKRAMKDLKGQLPPLQYYAHEEWDISTCLPWSAVQMSLSENLLRDHREQAMNLV
uniref:Uncharacterized protein n=1 Tax=Rhodosorus marinus TaxID=101924 RepID=A0A7S3EQ42_9RHOD|mmetsp:Transcript_8974/g.39619  ORF Transcript_8974/g.39619 Transcript_8974/m.39619 type:complete len:225 (+) Transcript_8974:1685-2359(+)